MLRHMQQVSVVTGWLCSDQYHGGEEGGGGGGGGGGGVG